MASKLYLNGAFIYAAAMEADFTVAKLDATAATTNPYIPSGATLSTQLEMGGYTGVTVRAKYVTGQTLTTDPVISVFGLRGASNWQILKDVNGARTSTLADSASDVSNGTNNWTDSTEKIDALGCDKVLVTVITAAVASSGAVSIEMARY
jgi:hypothetical protein